MSDDSPFSAVAYPIVEGVRSPTPYTSGSSTGGTVGAPSTPVTFGTNPSGTTKPTTQPTATTKGETHALTQLAIDRLGTIMTANTDATKQGTTYLGGKLDEIKQGIDAGNAKLGQIAANTSGGPGGGTHDNSDIIAEYSGDGKTVEPAEEGDGSGATAILAAAGQVRASLASLANSVNVTTPGGGGTLAFSIPVPTGGAVTINLEQYSGLIDVGRQLGLFAVVVAFLLSFISTVRGAFA